MRIAELVAYQARIPLKQTIRHASFTRNESDNLVVCCRLEDGTQGWGEGLPREYVTGETIESAFEQFQATDWRSQLADDVVDLPGAVRVCERLRLADGGHSAARDCFGNAVRCAVEIALLDAFCRVLGRPLSAVVEEIAETMAIRSQQPRVRYGGAWTPACPPSPFRDVLGRWKLRLFGFQ